MAPSLRDFEVFPAACQHFNPSASSVLALTAPSMKTPGMSHRIKRRRGAFVYVIYSMRKQAFHGEVFLRKPGILTRWFPACGSGLDLGFDH
jgi:hypothetical protein